MAANRTLRIYNAKVAFYDKSIIVAGNNTFVLGQDPERAIADAFACAIEKAFHEGRAHQAAVVGRNLSQLIGGVPVD